MSSDDPPLTPTLDRVRIALLAALCASVGDLLAGVPNIELIKGHHQPLRVWVLCLYFMGLNLSNEQIAAELELDADTIQVMATQLREGVVVKKSPPG